jgi:very-short-patch-repair endonuclease
MPDKRARQLRRAATDAERKLWSALRDRQLDGFKFRRQQSIGPYVVDFVCHETRLVIELDGGQHADRDETARTGRIKADGYRIIRFWNNDVLGNLEGVLLRIREELRK